MCYYEAQEREAREEDFWAEMERRHRDDPEYWKWYEERQKARAAAQAESEGVV